MNALKINRNALAVGLAALCLTVLAFSSGRTSASATKTVVNVAQNEDLDFKLVNQTGYNIKAVYIGPNNNPEWTSDMEVLHGRTFKSGTSLDITFHPKAKAAKWDLMVEWADGSGKEQWLGLDLTKIEKLTLLYDAEKDKTSVRIN
jgi:hypothetical protein